MAPWCSKLASRTFQTVLTTRFTTRFTTRRLEQGGRYVVDDGEHFDERRRAEMGHVHHPRL
jgi:hypothetical protein